MSDHPPDEALLRLSEGAGEPEAAAHARACVACGARVEAARAAAAWVAGAAPAGRGFCPPRPLLAGREELAPAERRRLDAHAAACPACRSELADLAALLTEPVPAQPGLLTTLRLRAVLLLDAARRGLELVEGSLLPAPVPALVPVRGGPAGQGGALGSLAPLGGGALQLTWVSGPEGVDLLCRAEGGAPRSFRLELGPADDPGAVWESRSADPQGAVRLSGLAPGRYLLRAYVPQEARPGLELELELRATDET